MERSWKAPDRFRRIETIDAHAAGEPLRVVTGGLPAIPGGTMLAKRRHAREHLDWARRALMLEPRGHADMYGCILTEPVTPDGDAGVLFMHNEGFSTMCGHGIVAVVTAGLTCGLLEPRDGPARIRLDTPAGRVTARAEIESGVVRSVAFENVASFVIALDAEADVPGLGKLRYDLAFGGAFYAFVQAADLGLAVEPAQLAALIDAGRSIKNAIAAARPISHPGGDADLGFLYGTILIGPGGPGSHSRNVCIFADGEVDRSPTGTGVSARAAILHARREIEAGERVAIESILGTRFEVAVGRTCRVGGLPAVFPEVRGSAYLTGRHEFLVDPADPLREGFLLR